MKCYTVVVVFLFDGGGILINRFFKNCPAVCDVIQCK